MFRLNNSRKSIIKKSNPDKIIQTGYLGSGYTLEKANEQANKIISAEPYKKYEDPNQSKVGNGIGLTGTGINLAGGEKPQYINNNGNQIGELPGDTLRKNLLKKMLKQKKMKSLGDRLKTQKLQGSGLNIPDTSNGESKSKTLPDTENYDMNPKPLVGQGKKTKKVGKVLKKSLKTLKKVLLPALIEEGYLDEKYRNSKNIEKLIQIRFNKIVDSGIKKPEEVSKKVIQSLKPLFKKKMKGNGMEMIEGGFIIAGLTSIIAAISAAASAALAATIGGVSVSSLIGAALTSGATAAGSAIVKKISGDGIKDKLLKSVKNIKLIMGDFSDTDKAFLKSEYNKLKNNPTKRKLKKFTKKIAPLVKRTIQKKLKPKIAEQIKKLKGGSFESEFSKNLEKTI